MNTRARANFYNDSERALAVELIDSNVAFYVEMPNGAIPSAGFNDFDGNDRKPMPMSLVKAIKALCVPGGIELAIAYTDNIQETISYRGRFMVVWEEQVINFVHEEAE